MGYICVLFSYIITIYVDIPHSPSQLKYLTKALQYLNTIFVATLHNFICLFVYFISDPPPADAPLFTDKYITQKIKEILTDEKYTTPLKLDVDKIDEEKLREQEELRKERAFPEQQKTFIMPANKKRKGKF